MVDHICLCGVKTGSQGALLKHWREEYEKGNQHFHCGTCMKLFHTPAALKAHDLRMHPIKQQLPCPGCDQEFATPGGLIDHIERSKCSRINSQEMAEARERKLAFARELQRRHFGQVPGSPEYALKIHPVGSEREATKGPFNFSRFISGTVDGAYGNTSLSSLRPTAGSAARPNPLSFNPVETGPQVPAPQFRSNTEFPPIGDKKTTAAVSPNVPADRSGSNPWTQNKNLFPDAPPPSRPTPKQLEAIREPAKNKGNAWPEHDPRNPAWDPLRSYNKFTQKYGCPYERCPKSFESSGGLRNHLLSAAHTNTWRVQCPMCMRWFDSTAALVQHGESPSVRCHLRKSEGYRHLLSQATAGIVDYAGEYENGQEKYSITDQARREWGAPEKVGVPGLQESVGSMSLTKTKKGSKEKNEDEEEEEWTEPAPNW